MGVPRSFLSGPGGLASTQPRAAGRPVVDLEAMVGLPRDVVADGPEHARHSPANDAGRSLTELAALLSLLLK